MKEAGRKGPQVLTCVVQMWYDGRSAKEEANVGAHCFYFGKVINNRDICICIADSLCYRAETNTPL